MVVGLQEIVGLDFRREILGDELLVLTSGLQYVSSSSAHRL